jgi:hypothetical protein
MHGKVSRWARVAVVAALVAAGINSTASADVFSNVPEVTAQGYQLVYDFNVPTNDNQHNTGGVVYTVDDSASAPASYDRVAYYLELKTGSDPEEWVYASMDSFQNNPWLLGVPNTVNHTQQRVVTNMNVFTNVPLKVTPGTGLATGNIEFWNTNYGGGATATVPGGTGQYDYDDSRSTGGGHGSMQVHNHGAGETLFSYNNWNDGGQSALGIGNSPSTHPDWTLVDNTGSYNVKRMQVLVRPGVMPKIPAPAGIVANVPEAADYKLVYELPIGNANNYEAGNVPYLVNNAAAHLDGSFKRVAYYLELDGPSGPQYAWVSMDPISPEADKLGVPNLHTARQFQRFVSDMNVVSNVVGVFNGTGITTGNIEFWPTNYAGENSLGVPGADNTLHDFGDDPRPGNYGSMQVHNYGAAQTVFAFNRWNGGGAPDLGIGNDPNTGRASYRPDWTFAQNGATYTLKNLYVLVEPTGYDTGNLVQNGSFEDPALPFDSQVYYSTGSTALTGWDIDGEVTLVHKTFTNDWASDRNQWLSLESNTGGSGGDFPNNVGTVSQDIETVPGAKYMLSFDYSALSRNENRTWELTYTVGDVTRMLTIEESGTAQFDLVPWATEAFVFRATDPLTTISLTGQTQMNGFWGTAIDNVGVYLLEIPEPSTLALAALGLLGLGAVSLPPLGRHRRRG